MRPRNPEIGVVYRRVAAFLLDFLLVWIVTSFIGERAGALGPNFTDAAAESLARWQFAAILVYRWAMQSAFGFTLGKLLLGLRLVADDGGPPGALRALGREVPLCMIVNVWLLAPVLFQYFVPQIASVISLWMALRRPDGRALHDLPMRTRVVRTRPAPGRQGGPPRPV